MVKMHSGHPLLMFVCSICGGTWKNYKTLCRHISRKHPNQSGEQNAFDANCYESSVDLPVTVEQSHAEKAQLLEEKLSRQSAAYILKLKAVHGISQSCVNDIMAYTRSIVQLSTGVAREKVLHSLNLVQPDDRLSSAFDIPVFSGIETEWQQNKNFRQYFGLLEPVEIKIGERPRVNHKTQCTEMVPVYGYYVPFLQSLKQILAIPDICRTVFRSPSPADCNTDDMIDFEDGLFCRQHPVFNVSSNIRILGYFDDVEVVNPIGVHTKKHKLGLFFWTLLNVPPALRSKLSCINVIAIAKSRDYKEFGLNLLLHDFVSGLNELYNNGISLEIDGCERMVKGGLVAFAGDTLASCYIGGFKEGVGFANKICRTCETTAQQSRTLLSHEDCIVRTIDEHRRRCLVLESALTRPARKYWSLTYGINSTSVRLDLEGFDLTLGLIHYPMHLFFEGVTELMVRLILK